MNDRSSCAGFAASFWCNLTNEQSDHGSNQTDNRLQKMWL